VQASEVLEVVRALEAAGLRVWLDGGWGIDALLGRQTRDHDDVDIVVELDRIHEARRSLEPLGFDLAEDYLPTRAVLRSVDGRQVDLHPITFDSEGAGWQKGAGPDGSDCRYRPDGFGHGHVLDEAVPCLTAELQLEHHCGYEPTDKDKRDMRQLTSEFGLALPVEYRAP